MNLRLAHKLISAAENQPLDPFKVRGREEAQEVHLMAQAGLVQEMESRELDPSEAVITRITHAGHQFYRALKDVRAYAST